MESKRYGQSSGPQHRYPPYAIRIVEWQDLYEPTPSALVRFVVAHREQFNHVKIPAAESSEQSEEAAPTDSADLLVTIRDISGRLRLPGRYTGHMLDAVTLGLGIAGMGYGAVAILKSGTGTFNPGIVLSICALYVVAVGTLTWAVIRRHWREGRT